MPVSRIDSDFSHLIELIYRGPLEPQPWQSALPALREAMDAQVVSLVLRPPTADDQGVILNSIRPDQSRNEDNARLADPNDWEVSAYREQFFSLDPFVNLPLDKVIALEDILPDRELLRSDYYLHYLKPIDLFRILGVDTAEPGGMLARLRFSRRASEARFKTRERTLLALLTPHLRLAIEIYAKLNRTTSERDVYAGAVNQLSVATIILDERGRMLTTNAVGQALLDQGEGLSLRAGRLHIEGRDIDKELQQALATIIKAQMHGETSVVRALRVPRTRGRSDLAPLQIRTAQALRVPRTRGRSDLGLVIRPVPMSQWSEGQSSPSVAVFISDPDLQESTSRQILGELFALTPAEANLATLLARGLSLAQVSSAQHVSQHTARAQLKSIFAKTGVSRQAELVRLVLKSVASLG